MPSSRVESARLGGQGAKDLLLGEDPESKASVSARRASVVDFGFLGFRV